MSRLALLLPALLLPLAVACGATVQAGDDDGPGDDGAADDGADGSTDDGGSSDGGSGDGSDDGSADDGSDDGGCTPCECGVEPPLCELGHAPAPDCDANGEWVCAPHECPSLGAMIEAGDPCDVEGLLCAMEFGCGPVSNIRCVDGRWAYEGQRCSPEPPACDTHGDVDTCEDWGCRWLEPGCGDETIPSLPGAGCFDPVPCAEGGCLADQQCTQVMVQPDCVDCDACGQSDAVCLPSAAGG